MEKEENKKNSSEQSTLKSVVTLLLIIAFILVVLIFFPNTWIWNIVVLLLILTLLIFVHEGGHFLLGKICGVHIYEFALGMGPKVLGFRRKNDPTEYTLRALPIGGFCQLAGEEGEDDSDLEKDKFMCNKSKIKRILILVAGVFMNFITAFVLLFAISLIWGTSDQTSKIGYIEKNSPAEKAGIVVGDTIVECNGKRVRTWDKLSIINSLKNENNYVEYVIRHQDGKEEKYKIVPDEYAVIDNQNIQITEENTVEKIAEEHHMKKEEVAVTKMIGIGADQEVKHGLLNALKYAFVKFTSIFSSMFMIIGSLITGKLGLSALSGPVGMYSVVGQVASYGIANVIYLMAYLSINLGVINILPFPAFDGGRVVFVIIEAITHKKVDPKVEGYFHSIGFILIMLLMLYITFQDIIRIF